MTKTEKKTIKDIVSGMEAVVKIARGSLLDYCPFTVFNHNNNKQAHHMSTGMVFIEFGYSLHAELTKVGLKNEAGVLMTVCTQMVDKKGLSEGTWKQLVKGIRAAVK